MIVHYEIHRGNPSDKTELVPLVGQTKKILKRAPRALATDRGYYSADNVNKLSRLGVRRVGIPKIGRLTQFETGHQRRRWFTELQRFRCGIEAGISLLKRRFSLGRVLAKGSPGYGDMDGLCHLCFQSVAANLT